MGFFLGIAISIGLVTGSIDGSITYATSISIAIYSLIGIFFPRTIGTSLSIIQVGSIFGGLFSLFTRNSNSLTANVLIFGIAFVGQHLIAAIRPNASASVGAETPIRKHKIKEANSTPKRQSRNNFDPTYWHELESNFKDGELPLGHLIMIYQIPETRYRELTEENPNRKKYLDDDYYRISIVRYTDEAIFFGAPEGEAINEYLDFTFKRNTRVPYSQITSIEVREDNSDYQIVKVVGAKPKFILEFKIQNAYRSELECLVDVCKANKSENKYFELSRLTNDPRMNYLWNLTREPLSKEESDLARTLSAKWAKMWEEMLSKNHEGSDVRIYELTLFMKSNFSKLGILNDPKHLYRYQFPNKSFYNSLSHSMLGGELSRDFEKSLSEALRTFESGLIPMPKDFQETVTGTRKLFQHPRAKVMFSDLRFTYHEDNIW